MLTETHSRLRSRLVPAAATLIASAGLAHAMVVNWNTNASTIAEVFIEPTSITIALEIGSDELPLFGNLLADPLESRLPKFFEQDLVLRVDEGPPLIGRIVEARSETERVHHVTLVYPLEWLPEALTLEPPRDLDGSAAQKIALMVYHRGLPVMDVGYLESRERLWLDWDDPWYSNFENRDLRRQFDAPMAAFLYVEPGEVRTEIVLRPRDLEPWIDLGLQGSEVIALAEQAELERKVAVFLAERTPVTIDGETVQGELDRVEFIYRNLRTSGVIDPPRALATISAILGVIFVYPTEQVPRQVTLRWNLFGERLREIPAVATDQAGSLQFVLTQESPVLEWRNLLGDSAMPAMTEVASPCPVRTGWWVVGAVLAGAGLIGLGLRQRGRTPEQGRWPVWVSVLGLGLALFAGAALYQTVRSADVDDEQAKTVLTGLLRNVYRAFDQREESRIYDTLERSVAGDLLTKVYLETRRSLELQNQGGARVRVQQVNLIESKQEALQDARGFVAHCTWNVSGSVGHWGHTHQRTNQYQARLTVEAVEGAWKITDFELLQEERL